MDSKPQWPLKEEMPGDVAGNKAPWYRLEPMPVQHTDSGRLSAPWQTGFWKRFPARGLTALLFALGGTVAAVFILLYSDEVPVADWDARMQPTVWLALTSAGTGIFLGCAFADGAAISYWRAAGRPTTLQDLHAVYESSTGIVEAAINLFCFKSKVLGLASILMTLSMLRGPLMQQASSTTNIYKDQHGTFDFHIARELPLNWGSIITGRNYQASLLTRNFSEVAQEYNNRDDMIAFETDCNNCTTSVQGFGFDVNCTDSTRSFNMSSMSPMSMDGEYLFQVNVSEYYNSQNPDPNGAVLRLTTLYKDTAECDGKLKIQTCDLHGGIAKFPVEVNKNKVKLRGTWKDDEFIQRKEMLPQGTESYQYGGNVIGAFSIITDSIYSSSAYLHFGGAMGYDISAKGIAATQYYTMNGTVVSCADRWSNPMSDLIEMSREIGFRASLKYAHFNETDKQTLPYDSGTTTLVYVTNYKKMWIAVAVSLVGIFSVLPIFWGWWELGRAVSLNPLEIANAFGTVGHENHMMNSIDPNQPVGGIVRAANDIGPVRYGAWEVEGGVVRLGFAGAGMVRTPGNGERFVY